MIYRRVRLADINRTFPLMMRGLAIMQHPALRPSERRIRDMAEQCITIGFAAIAEDAEPVAYIFAVPAEQPFYEGLQVCVLGWYSERVGAGFRLLRMLREWVDTNPMLHSILITTNPDDRLRRHMEHIGAVTFPSYFLAR